MGTAGVNRDLTECDAPHVMSPGDAGDRMARSPRPLRHLLPVHRVAPDRGINAASRLDDAPYEGHVFFLNLAVVELP
jgi:hypothetical protein